VGRFEDPPLARALFASPAFAWIWLILRVWLGYQWFQAGEHKVFDPKWMETGEAIKGFWTRAITVPPNGKPAVAFDWYQGFIQMLLDGGHHVWFAKLVAVGEVAIGIALILGIFTGIAALAGGFMNWNFMMAGTASTNPMLFLVAVLLVLAWKVAGYWGVDRFLLPALGTPWKLGFIFRPVAQAPAATRSGS
jgi:thiosulfate dehydrogenase [quinone] large subunit